MSKVFEGIKYVVMYENVIMAMFALRPDANDYKETLENMGYDNIRLELFEDVWDNAQDD